MELSMPSRQHRKWRLCPPCARYPSKGDSAYTVNGVSLWFAVITSAAVITALATFAAVITALATFAAVITALATFAGHENVRSELPGHAVDGQHSVVADCAQSHIQISRVLAGLWVTPEHRRGRVDHARRLHQEPCAY